MDKSRGRRRRRKHVVYDDIVPSTDLPPLVEGELRCFLFVTIGDLIWGTTTTNKVPPASPVYIRLRWWGEASNGTYFRPQSKKLQQAVKCRGQFGIRSGPKQITAYFNDMGSATFDVLSSPTSLPIGRALVPGVSTLSSSNPIRGFFPIMSASSRKLGELQISMSFKPLKAAFEESSDTMTDGSYSARSRTASLGGLESRQSSQSRASSVGSTKSRSSSRGSRASRSGSINRKTSNGRRSTSGRRSKKARSRSKSTDSKASLEASTHDIPTPRGIDALLERNGHNLYRMNKGRLESKRDVAIKTTVSTTQRTDTVPTVTTDALSELLQRGRKLQEEINRSRRQDFSTSPIRSQPLLPPELPSSSYQIPQQPTTQPFIPPNVVTTTVQAPVVSTYAPVPQPLVQKQRSHCSLKLVDMLFKGSGVKTTDINTPDMSMVSTPQCSMVSDSDDPLHDESILQQLFYNNVNTKPMQGGFKESSDNLTGVQNHLSQAQKSASNMEINDMHQSNNKTTIITPSNTRKLENITLARVSIRGLQLASSVDFEEDFSLSKRSSPSTNREKGRRAKPPMSASQIGSQNAGRTFFVEYKFPHTIRTHKSIAITTSNHEVTRVASRKVSKNGLVKFDQHSVFNIHFNPATVSKWSTENMEFVVYQKRPKDKKASIMGCGVVHLKDVLNNRDLSFCDHLKISPKTSDQHLNTKVYGVLKVSIELIDDSKDLPMLMSPSKKPSEVTTPLPYTVTRNLSANETQDFTPTKQRANVSFLGQGGDSPKVCLASEDSYSEETEVNAQISSRVLYLYIMLERARNIPATKLQSGPSAGKISHSNVYLVCRTFAADEAATTAVSWNTSNPKFGFTQVVPVKINHLLFGRLRNNYVVIEVWTKVPSDKKFSDKLLGLVKIPLQIFYQSLKDSEVARAVLNAEYPLVSVDGYQSIVDVFSGSERGQLKALLAMGTQTQVNALRKLKSSEEPDRDHHLDEKKKEGDDQDRKNDNLHSLRVTIHGLSDFQPLNTQVWGETDCFVQYRFPTQQQLNNSESSDETITDDDMQDSVSMQCFRTDTTLCVPNPQFNCCKKHLLYSPPSIPVHKLLLSSYSSLGKSPGGGVPFEVWSRFYYPNVRDQLLAKGTLPLAKLNAMLTMTNKRNTEQTFQIPLEYVDPDSRSRSAGDLNITIKYKSSAGCKKMASQASSPFFKNVKLQIAVLRACGLKAAAKMKASVTGDSDLDYCSEVGVNSFVRMQASFSPSQKPRETRCVARTFAPDYNHHFEIDCPVLTFDDDEASTCLASQLAAGEILLEVWHKPVVEDAEGKFKSKKDVLLGRIQISTSCLLFKTTGCNSWHPVTCLESLQQKSSSTVGAVEVAMSFSCRSDLDLILRAAKSVSWTPTFKSDLSRLLVPTSNGILKPIEDTDSSEDHFTTCLTVTNAWLPKKLLTFPGSDEINKYAHIYLRYKFYDKDTVVSSICPVASASERKSFKQHDVFPVKLAHRKSFLCRATQPLVWYLREETLEIQVWLSHSRSSRTRKRPFDSDKLIGTAHVDLSSVLVGGLHRQQHISNLYPLFKAGIEDMGDAAIRVYLSLSPGDHTQTCDLETLDESTTSSTDNVLNSSKEFDETLTCEGKHKRRGPNRDYFAAIVSVERAMHLNSLPSQPSDIKAFQTCYVTFPVAGVGSKTVEATKAVERSSCPVWNDAKEVMLARKVLDKDSGNMMFRVWQRDAVDPSLDQTSETDQKPSPTSDKVIGFVNVDISVLQAGFRAVNGWYNILDIHGHCQGQIKLAVTPTEPLYTTGPLVSDYPKDSKTLQHQSPSRQKGILHSVPLLGPVETPSGSLYYPGVAASKSRETIGSLLDDVITSLPITTQTRTTYTSAATTSSAPVRVDSMPRLAMFQHDSSTTLQSVLQRQMKELDEIKEAFSQKKLPKAEGSPSIHTLYASEFLKAPPSNSSPSNFTAAPPPFNFTAAPPEQRSETPELESPLLKETEAPITTATTSSSSSSRGGSSSSHSGSSSQSEANVPAPSGLSVPHTNCELSSSTPNRSKPAPTVHLSLFKPNKNRTMEFDGAALSDNEMSDVEFVSPVNLNEGVFPNEEAPLPDSMPSPSVDFKSSPDSFPVSPEQGSSAHPSDLNNTSLWLSASTSQTENVSAAEKAPPEENSSQDEFETTPKAPVSPADLDDETKKLEKGDEPVCQLDFEEQLELPTESRTLPEDQNTPEEDHGIAVSENEDSQLKRRNENEVESKSQDEDDVEELPPESAEAVPDDGLPNGIPEVEESLESEEGSSTEEESSSSEDTISELPNTDTAPPNKDEVPLIEINQRETHPSCSYVAGSCEPPQEWTSIPSFFPPRKDLFASMKTLQAITTEQKQNLEETEDKENSFSAVQHVRPRRKLMRPATHTSEQTERLARIFSTKFT